MADEFDTLIQQIVIDDSRAAPALARYIEAFNMLYQKIEGIGAITTAVANKMGISWDAAKQKLMDLYNVRSTGAGVDLSGPGSFGYDPKLFDKVVQSAGASTEAYNNNKTALGGLVETYPAAATEINRLADAWRNSAAGVKYYGEQGQSTIPGFTATVNKHMEAYNSLGNASAKINFLKTAIRDYSDVTGLSLEKSAAAITRAGNSVGAFANDTQRYVPQALKSLQKEVGGVSAELTRMGEVFYHVWTAMMAFQVVQWVMQIGQAFRQAITDGLAFANAMNEMVVAIRSMQSTGMEVTIKQATDAVAELKEKFPIFTEKDIVVGFSTILLKTREMNLSIEDSMKLMEIATGSAIEKNKTIDQSIDALIRGMQSVGSILSGARVLEMTGMDIRQQNVLNAALDLGYENAKKGYEALTVEEKAMAFLAVAAEQYATIEKDIEALMKTRPNQVSEVSSEWKDLTKDIGYSVAQTEAFGTGLRYLIDDVFPALKVIATGCIETIVTSLFGLAAVTAVVAAPLIALFGALSSISKGDWKGAWGAGMGAVGGTFSELWKQWINFVDTTNNPPVPFLPDNTINQYGVPGGLIGPPSLTLTPTPLPETVQETLDIARETAAKIFDLKLSWLDEEQQAELTTAQETADAILAIKDRALTETEVKNLAVAEETAAKLLKINLEAQRKFIVDSTSWKVLYTDAKDATEKTKLSLDLLGDMMQKFTWKGQALGALFWDEFLTATGEVSSSAIQAMLEIMSMYESLVYLMKQGYTIPVIVNWFQTGEGIYGKDEEPLVPWYDVGQAPKQEAGAIYSETGYGSAVRNGVMTVLHWKVPEYDSEGNLTYSYHAGGGFIPVGGIGVVGDAPGRRTGYEELVQPMPGGGAMVYNQSQMSGFSAIPPSNGADAKSEINIVVHNPLPRAAEESISRELLTLNYLGIIK